MSLCNFSPQLHAEAQPTKTKQKIYVGTITIAKAAPVDALPKVGTDAGLGDSFSHAATAAGVAIMVSNSIGVKRPSAA